VTKGNGNIRCIPIVGSFDSRAPVDISSRSISSHAHSEDEAEEQGTVFHAGLFPREKVHYESTTSSSRSELLIECELDTVKCLEVQCQSDIFYTGKDERILFPMSISTSDLSRYFYTLDVE
jgi:hypothetical protein